MDFSKSSPPTETLFCYAFGMKSTTFRTSARIRDTVGALPENKDVAFPELKVFRDGSFALGGYASTLASVPSTNGARSLPGNGYIHTPGSFGAAAEISFGDEMALLSESQWKRLQAFLKATPEADEKVEEVSPYVRMAEEFLGKTLKIVKAKNADYCADSVADPLENLRLSEKVGICDTKTAILSRMMDKIARARNLILDPEREAQVDEAIEDTLSDIIGYTLLLNYAVQEND